MENQHQQYQRWVQLGYLIAAGLLAYILFTAGAQLVGKFDLEARVKNVDLILRGVSVLSGALLFLILYNNEKSNQFMTEVVVELSRVTWPAQKETSWATFLVIVMVLISGVVLGFFDYLWTVVIKQIIS